MNDLDIFAYVPNRDLPKYENWIFLLGGKVSSPSMIVSGVNVHNERMRFVVSKGDNPLLIVPNISENPKMLHMMVQIQKNFYTITKIKNSHIDCFSILLNPEAARNIAEKDPEALEYWFSAELMLQFYSQDKVAKLEFLKYYKTNKEKLGFHGRGAFELFVFLESLSDQQNLPDNTDFRIGKKRWEFSSLHAHFESILKNS